MNDEIKEILKKIKSVSDFDDYVDFIGTEFKPLLDYITNLQEELEYYENIDPDKTIDKFRQKINREMFNLQKENKKLKHNLEQMYNDTKDTYNEICAEQIDYKSRNEKAIEEIDIIDTTLLSNINSYIAYKIEKVKDILQGSDEK